MASVKVPASVRQLPKTGKNEPEANVVYNTRQTAPPLKNNSSAAKHQSKQSPSKEEENMKSIYGNRFRLGNNPEWLHTDYSPYKRDELRTLRFRRNMDLSQSRAVGEYDPSASMRAGSQYMDRPNSQSSTSSRGIFANSMPYESLRQRLTGFHYEFDREITPKIGSVEKHYRVRKSTLVKIGHNEAVNSYEVW